MDESGLEIFCQTPKKEKKSVLSIEKFEWEFYELSSASTINSQTSIDMIMLRIGC